MISDKESLREDQEQLQNAIEDHHAAMTEMLRQCRVVTMIDAINLAKNYLVKQDVSIDIIGDLINIMGKEL